MRNPDPDPQLDRAQIATLRAIDLNPGHTPVDGLSLDRLRLLGLTIAVPEGQRLSEKGRLLLTRALAEAVQRDAAWSGDHSLSGARGPGAAIR